MIEMLLFLIFCISPAPGRHSHNARNDNQTPQANSTSYSSRQPSLPGTTSGTVDPSIPEGEAVKDIDLTDRIIHKLVNDQMLNQVEMPLDGSNQKSEEESKSGASLVNTSDDSTEPGHDKIDGQEEPQAKMDKIKQPTPPNQQEPLQRQHHQGQSNIESERVGVESFRTPPFIWSYLHQILLDSILRSIEDEFHAIATTTSSKEKLETELPPSNSADADEYDVAGSMAVAQLQAFINEPANQIYAINLIHLISQLSDSLVTACGGLLPLLAATTSPTMELEIQEPSSGLLLETAFGFLLRVANIADVVVFMPAASINLSTLEKETGMNAGGIVRQCLRLACLCAVRNCLESRLRDFLPTPEILSQIHTLPTPHHHIASPLSSPLHDNETELRPRATSSTSSTSTPTADLADSSLPPVDKRHSKSRLLSGFHFYSLLRNKAEVIQRLANPTASNAGLSKKHFSPDCIAYLDRLGNLPRNLQHLALGLRPSMASYPSEYMGGIFDKTVGNPLHNIESLLQNVDLNRLHNVIYRDEDETRQVQFVALAVIYFLSVLMVSKYRDLLDPVNLLTVCHREAAVTDQSPQPPVSPAAWRLGSSSPSSNAIAGANSPEG
ncbi:unnamed protein product [Rodentolepis nana]|uniref:HECT domain-containing protein n=1 Tax=Rodentolepis nana TaxID=102285 RepID=A0A0R3U031_RODNA|nr:unnamed protein product [Rodentolepis nana]